MVFEERGTVGEKRGRWLGYKADETGQGQESGSEDPRENTEISLDIENRVRAHFGVKPRGLQVIQGGKKGSEAA